MSWNYRILAHEEEEGDSLAIHTVYYTQKEPVRYSERPSFVTGGTVEEMVKNMRQLQLSLEKPILYAGDKFPQIYKP